MKNKIGLAALFISIIFMAYSNEKSAVLQDENYRFSFGVQGINNNLMSYSDLSTGDKLLGAAIGFTVSDSACLVLGISGAAIMGASFNMIFATQTAADTMLYAGVAMTALFFTFFALLLPGVILFWVLYAVNKGPSAKNFDVSDGSIALKFTL